MSKRKADDETNFQQKNNNDKMNPANRRSHLQRCSTEPLTGQQENIWGNSDDLPQFARIDTNELLQAFDSGDNNLLQFLEATTTASANALPADCSEVWSGLGGANPVFEGNGDGFGDIFPPTPSVSQPQQEQGGLEISRNPMLCATSWPGEFHFKVSVTTNPMEKNKWCYSDTCKKLYTVPNHAVPIEVHVNEWRFLPPNCSMTVVAVFKQSQHRSSGVPRCYNCSVSVGPHQYREHVVQINGDTCMYEEVHDRYYVHMPLIYPNGGEDFSVIFTRIMCLQSCVGGPNRRPFQLVYSLKNQNGDVIGRDVLDVRSCKCPCRDLDNDETKKRDEIKNEEMAQQISQVRTYASGLAASHSIKRKKGNYRVVKVEPPGHHDHDELVELTLLVPKQYVKEIKKQVNMVFLYGHKESKAAGAAVLPFSDEDV